MVAVRPGMAPMHDADGHADHRQQQGKRLLQQGGKTVHQQIEFLHFNSPAATWIYSKKLPTGRGH